MARNCTIPVLISKAGISAEQLTERGYQPQSAEQGGFIITLSVSNRYRGDDETVVFKVDWELDWLENEDWTILWQQASY